MLKCELEIAYAAGKKQARIEFFAFVAMVYSIVAFIGAMQSC